MPSLLEQLQTLQKLLEENDHAAARDLLTHILSQEEQAQDEWQQGMQELDRQMDVLHARRVETSKRINALRERLNPSSP